MVKQGKKKKWEVPLLIALHLVYGATCGILRIVIAVFLGRTQSNLLDLFFGAALAGVVGFALALAAWTLIFRRRREQLSLAGVLFGSLMMFVAIGSFAVAIEIAFRLPQGSDTSLILGLPSIFLVLMPLWLRYDVKRPKGFEYVERQSKNR